MNYRKFKLSVHDKITLYYNIHDYEVENTCNYFPQNEKDTLLIKIVNVDNTILNEDDSTGTRSIFRKLSNIEMLCAILYHLYNLKNVKNTHRGVLLLIKLQDLACNFTTSNTTPWVFFYIF